MNNIDNPLAPHLSPRIGDDGASTSGVTFVRDRMSVHFDRFDPPAYTLFLKCKKLPEYQISFEPKDESYTITAPARFAATLGLERPDFDGSPIPFNPLMLDDQVYLTQRALDAKRFAVWSGCGNGKTLIGWEFARHVVARTGGRFLITTLNDLVEPWIEEAAKFYGDTLPILRLRTRLQMREWMAGNEPDAPLIAITNYEKWNPTCLADQVVNEARYLAGIGLDESSRLKGGGGKQKWAIIKSCRGIEYKLSLTATPAPNDTIEFASQASFLEKMRTDADIIWTYFSRDAKTQKWTVKPHARRAFFEFMSSWSIYVNNPKRYGWRKNIPDVPAPVYKVIEIDATDEQRKLMRLITADAKTGQMNLFSDDETNVIQRNKLSQIAKGFRYINHKGKTRTVEHVPSKKPAVVEQLIRDEVKSGAQTLVWTVFDRETTILSERLGKLRGVAVITGKTEPSERVAILDKFRKGEIRCLISRAKMLGYGMNFQFCQSMIFSGWTDSFEDLYQAVRRAVRHGQQDPVRVYFPVVPELEGDTLANVKRKEAEFERSIADMEENYLLAQKTEMAL